MIARRLAPLILALTFSLVSCSGNRSDASGPGGAELPTIAVGDVPLKMEFAITPSQLRRGLMYRDGIAADHGMLFIYDEPQQMSYWMKNVDFPIDIGFFTADGVLREVYPMYPNDTNSRKSRRDDLLYALEVKENWFKENKVFPGAKLDLEALEAALADRKR